MPLTTMTGSGSKRKESDKGTQKCRTRDPEKRTGNEKKKKRTRMSVLDVARRVIRKGTLSVQKITSQRK
jgi:hypothetical protein